MKNQLSLFLLSFLLIALSSCNKSTEGKNKAEDIIKNNIELKLKETMNDPNSFEFVSMEITDTLSVRDRREFLNDEKYKNIIENPYTSSQMLFLVKELYTFLQKQTDEEKDAVYYIDYNIRGKNSFGAKVLSNYSVTVLNDEAYTVLLLK